MLYIVNNMFDMCYHFFLFSTPEQIEIITIDDAQAEVLLLAIRQAFLHAAAMGGNVIYGVSSPTQGLLSSFVPTDSEMNGQVYKCPN